MDIRDDKFKLIPEDKAEADYMIPFEVGEFFTIEGYQFEVYSIDIDANLMVLKPRGAVSKSLKDKLSKLKTKGGLGL